MHLLTRRRFSVARTLQVADDATLSESVLDEITAADGASPTSTSRLTTQLSVDPPQAPCPALSPSWRRARGQRRPCHTTPAAGFAPAVPGLVPCAWDWDAPPPSEGTVDSARATHCRPSLSSTVADRERSPRAWNFHDKPGHGWIQGLRWWEGADPAGDGRGTSSAPLWWSLRSGRLERYPVGRYGYEMGD